jgi:hypothetical protein
MIKMSEPGPTIIVRRDVRSAPSLLLQPTGARPNGMTCHASRTVSKSLPRVEIVSRCVEAGAGIR